jgi:hypothetical protein
MENTWSNKYIEFIKDYNFHLKSFFLYGEYLTKHMENNF